jgi:hypothetical protein
VDAGGGVRPGLADGLTGLAGVAGVVAWGAPVSFEATWVGECPGPNATANKMITGAAAAPIQPHPGVRSAEVGSAWQASRSGMTGGLAQLSAFPDSDHAADMPNMSEVGQTRRAGSIDGSSAAFVSNAPFSRMADGRPQ